MGATISGYEQFRPIGSGGFSTVYEARQPELNRKVAVKVLTIGAGHDFDRAAFEGECRAMGTVSEHPNIVTVYESGFSQEGLPYITMELYNETLLDRIRSSGFLPLEDVLEIGVQMAGALHRAHEDRLLHRDIKPQNIFFSQYGEPFLGDFGIAALAHEQHVQKSFGLTFHYAAPEVLDGQMPTVSSDIYSLGATLYTALAGHRPFARPGQKEGEAAITNRILSEPPPPVTTQRIPENIEREILSLLAKHENDRPRSALAVGKMFRDMQQRLGFQPTPMRVATHALNEDHTVPRMPSGQAPPISTPSQATALDQSPTHSAATGVVDDAISESVTIYRSQESKRPTADFAEPAKDKRQWVGVAALAAVVLLAGVGIAFSLDSGADLPETANDGASTTTTRVVAVASPPAPVTGVAVRAEGAEYIVTWEDADRASEYQVEFPVGGLESSRIPDTELRIASEDVTGVFCVTVQSISDSGKTAPKSDQVCGG